MGLEIQPYRNISFVCVDGDRVYAPTLAAPPHGQSGTVTEQGTIVFTKSSFETLKHGMASICRHTIQR